MADRLVCIELFLFSEWICFHDAFILDYCSIRRNLWGESRIENSVFSRVNLCIWLGFDLFGKKFFNDFTSTKIYLILIDFNYEYFKKLSEIVYNCLQFIFWFIYQKFQFYSKFQSNSSNLKNYIYQIIVILIKESLNIAIFSSDRDQWCLIEIEFS